MPLSTLPDSGVPLPIRRVILAQLRCWTSDADSTRSVAAVRGKRA